MALHPRDAAVLAARLVASGHRPRADREPVPAVYRNGGHGKIDQFLLGKLLPRPLVDLVAHVSLGDPGDGLGPLQGRPLSLAEERRLAPGVERIEALLAFARSPCVLGVHVYAERAAVDLGRAHPHQLKKSRLEPALAYVTFERLHGLHRPRRHLCVLYPRFHPATSSQVSPDPARERASSKSLRVSSRHPSPQQGSGRTLTTLWSFICGNAIGCLSFLPSGSITVAVPRTRWRSLPIRHSSSTARRASSPEKSRSKRRMSSPASSAISRRTSLLPMLRLSAKKARRTRR